MFIQTQKQGFSFLMAVANSTEDDFFRFFYTISTSSNFEKRKHTKFCIILKLSSGQWHYLDEFDKSVLTKYLVYCMIKFVFKIA